MAAMEPERSRSLHNFSLSPRLKWGTQKLLRCATLNHGDPDRKRRLPRNQTHTKIKNKIAPSSSHPSSSRRESISGDGQIEAIREKLMLDLRSEVDKMRAAFLGNSHRAPSTPPVLPPPPPPSTAPEIRPWNLRTRRAACKEPAPPASEKKAPMKPVPGVGSAGAGDSCQRAKFALSLSRQEIEDDYAKMVRRRPPRKPKKRPRHVQRDLDAAFPGFWLSEITPDMYEVDENPEIGK